jgi:hypothetical protein
MLLLCVFLYSESLLVEAVEGVAEQDLEEFETGKDADGTVGFDFEVCLGAFLGGQGASALPTLSDRFLFFDEVPLDAIFHFLTFVLDLWRKFALEPPSSLLDDKSELRSESDSDSEEPESESSPSSDMWFELTVYFASFKLTGCRAACSCSSLAMDKIVSIMQPCNLARLTEASVQPFS